MVYDRSYDQIYKANERIIDKELGQRYRSNEALNGESFTDFKKRIIKEELQSIKENANKVYPAWVRMPNETEQEFRKRLVAKRPDDPEVYPAWEKAPNEPDEEFKKRFTAKKMDKRI